MQQCMQCTTRQACWLQNGCANSTCTFLNRSSAATPGSAVLVLHGCVLMLLLRQSLVEKMDRQTAQDFAFDILDVQNTGAASK